MVKGKKKDKVAEAKMEEVKALFSMPLPFTPQIKYRNGIFNQLGPRKRNVYPGKQEELDLTWSKIRQMCSDLAISNGLDLQYQIVGANQDTLSIGAISEDFLHDLSEIIGSHKFSCILYDPYKDLVAIHQWPNLKSETFDIRNWVNFRATRIVWILGLWS